MSLPTLLQVCVLRVFCVLPTDEVIAQLPAKILEALFAPLRDMKDPRNLQVRKWLAHSSRMLPLRGAFEVRGTRPVRSVMALANCDRLSLRIFDVSALANTEFKNLARLSIQFPMPQTTALNIDDIYAPSLKTISIMLTNRGDSEQDLQTLFKFMNTKTVRRCERVIVAYFSFGALPFYDSVARLPIDRRRSRIRQLRFEMACRGGMEMLFLHRTWTNTVHTLVIQVSGDVEDTIMAMCFQSVRVLGLLRRPLCIWTPKKVASLCVTYFPRVEKVAAVCSVKDDDLPIFFVNTKHLFFGDAHPLNRGDPTLNSIVCQ